MRSRLRELNPARSESLEVMKMRCALGLSALLLVLVPWPAHAGELDVRLGVEGQAFQVRDLPASPFQLPDLPGLASPRLQGFGGRIQVAVGTSHSPSRFELSVMQLREEDLHEANDLVYRGSVILRGSRLTYGLTERLTGVDAMWSREIRATDRAGLRLQLGYRYQQARQLTTTTFSFMTADCCDTLWQRRSTLTAHGLRTGMEARLGLGRHLHLGAVGGVALLRAPEEGRLAWSALTIGGLIAGEVPIGAKARLTAGWDLAARLAATWSRLTVSIGYRLDRWDSGQRLGINTADLRQQPANALTVDGLVFGLACRLGPVSRSRSGGRSGSE
jgi:hypothetical protein